MLDAFKAILSTINSHPELWEVLHERCQHGRQVVGDLLYVGGQQRLVVDVAVSGADRVVDKEDIGLFDLRTAASITLLNSS